VLIFRLDFQFTSSRFRLYWERACVCTHFISAGKGTWGHKIYTHTNELLSLNCFSDITILKCVLSSTFFFTGKMLSCCVVVSTPLLAHVFRPYSRYVSSLLTYLVTIYEIRFTSSNKYIKYIKQAAPDLISGVWQDASVRRKLPREEDARDIDHVF
jgi:hypothetical protein